MAQPMNEYEKAIYVLSDFIQNFMQKVGTLPERKEIADKWLEKKFLERSNWFTERYKDSSMKDFAVSVWNAYSDMVEKEYHNRFWNEEYTLEDYAKSVTENN